MGRHTRLLMGVAVLALLALLVGFAVTLLNSQASDRRDVENRFRERAQISASLTHAIFAAATTSSQEQNAKRYGSQHVSTRTLARGAKQGNSTYLVLLDQSGRIIGASPGVTPVTLRSILAKPTFVRQALAGQPFALSNVQRVGGGVQAIGFAQPFNTGFGRRVLISGTSPAVLATFLGGYLGDVPNVQGGQAYVLDQRDAVVGSPQPNVAIGRVVTEPGLVAALATGDHGSFDGNRYFTSSSIQDSPWRVVLTASQPSLFASVSGSHKWVPWILFGAFAAAALIALGLLSRVLRSAARVGTLNDELGLANATLERRATELTRSNEELERFASIASHDLKEPLRKVQTFADRLADTETDNLSEGGRDYLERMGSAAGRMQNLIDDLLKFSRITAEVRPATEVDLTQVAREVLSNLEAVIEETGATVEVGGLPTVFADPLQMRQLLQNLVSNGLKFRREGVPPVVRIAGRLRGSIAEITVADNGIGFDPKYASRIFRIFERLHGRGKYAGTGIGLVLCRRIVERHGGTIAADSTPGEGSTFTVSLPVKPLVEPFSAFSGPGTPGKESPLVHA